MKKVMALVGLASVLLLNGCIAVSSKESPKQFMDSSIITASVKARLAGTAGLETLSINVSTLSGAILLSGFAQNEEQKRVAGRVAETTEGVQKVINNIVVQ
ncbi:MAG: BON domain-containing protein [Campylobacterota bacterium]|nr:BON domain-containing protein [Campylobacterota bacterium]